MLLLASVVFLLYARTGKDSGTPAGESSRFRFGFRVLVEVPV